jgi:hypothetical protein
MVQTRSTDRSERHNDVTGTLLTGVQPGGAILIAPEVDSDSPKGLMTSKIIELGMGDDGAIMVQTRNTLYRLTEINK